MLARSFVRCRERINYVSKLKIGSKEAEIWMRFNLFQSDTTIISKT